MPDRKQIVELLRENYPYLAAEYGVKRIGLFGSYARGTPDEGSDVDILVEFEHPIGLAFIDLVDHLEQLLGKSVDVLTPAGIQGIRLESVARGITESIVYV